MKQNYFSTMISRAAMMLFVVLCSLTAWAQDFTQNNVNYYIADDGETAYVGSSSEATGDLTILDKITVDGKDYPVTVIGDYALSRTSLTSVVIPNSVLRIETHAFYYCEQLLTVTIGSGVTCIGYDAFFCSRNVEDVYMYADPEALDWSNEGGCDDFKSDGSTVCHVADAAPWQNKFRGIVNLLFRDPHTIPFSYSYNEATHTLTLSGQEPMLNYADVGKRPWHSYASEIETVVIEEGVASIGEYAFYECTSLTSVLIPSSVGSIGDDSFCGCASLTSIDIPASLTDFNPRAFSNCANLMAINIASDNPEYKTVDGNVYSKSGNSLVRLAPGKSSFDITSDVEHIGDYAAYECPNLTSLTIPANVQEISTGAFCNCWGLQEIKLSEGLKTICYDAFSCAKLVEVTIPNSVETVYGSPFYGCDELRVANIGTGLNEFSYEMFKGCPSLQNIYVAKDNPYIKSVGGIVLSKDGKYVAIFPSGRTSAVIPEGVTEITDNCFSGNKVLKSVTLPNSLEIIGENAFANCDNLTSITIPNNVTDIKSHAIYDCDRLESVTIGSGVTYIGYDAFFRSYRITDVYFYADPEAFREWYEGGCDDFMYDKATICHVFNADACKAKWEDVARVTFVSDLLPQVEAAEMAGSNLTTYYNSTDNVKVDAGTQVFKVAMNGSQLSATEVEDRIIKAGEGVVLKSQGGIISMATTTEESAADYSDNILEGVDVDTSKPVGHKYYTLAETSNDIAFFEMPGNTLHAHKAYIEATSGPIAYYFDDATGISLMEEGRSQMEGGAIYNLAGQRLQKMQRGINIVGGKKIAVK